MPNSQFATYQEGMDFLFQAVDYEKLTRFKYDVPTFSLDRVRRFFDALGTPQNAFRSVHIAGTKGKGSTATMVAAVLREAGYKVGLFTSPHLVDLEERIVVDGQMIGKDDTRSLLSETFDYVSRERRDAPKLCPTFFEIVTAMAFLHFRRVGVDYAVVEVGLGGRLDSTNVIVPEACGITTIGFDHVDKLGDTLAKIAGEKAGIIKPGVPLVTAVDQPEAFRVIKAKCEEKSAPLYRVGPDVEMSDCRVSRGDDTIGTTLALRTWRHAQLQIDMPVLGEHQTRNAAVALGISAALEEVGSLPPLEPDAVRRAFRTLKIPGRVEIVGKSPTTILDGAHTVESVRALREAIQMYLPHGRLILIIGVSADKNVDGILEEIVPHAAEVIFSQSDSPRAVPAETLSERSMDLCGKSGTVQPIPAEALRVARALATPQDTICTTGSFYLAGKIKEAAPG